MGWDFFFLNWVKIAPISQLWLNLIPTIAQTAWRNICCMGLDLICNFKFRPNRRVTPHTIALLTVLSSQGQGVISNKGKNSTLIEKNPSRVSWVNGLNTCTPKILYGWNCLLEIVATQPVEEWKHCMVTKLGNQYFKPSSTLIFWIYLSQVKFI